MADLPSQYAEEVETFRRILEFPDPRDTMPRSSTSVLDLVEKKDQQELGPRDLSSVFPLSSHIKDAFDKFKHDLVRLPILNPLPAKWYMVGQPCYLDKIQGLNTDFSIICIYPKPSGTP